MTVKGVSIRISVKGKFRLKRSHNFSDGKIDLLRPLRSVEKQLQITCRSYSILCKISDWPKAYLYSEF